MNFDPEVFGIGFHQFVQMEAQLFGQVLSPIMHICTLIILLMSFAFGNKMRVAFTAYFTLNWLFLFGYWGVYAALYWAQIGVMYLISYIAAPILLALIAIFWCLELFRKKNITLDFKNKKRYRWAVLAILIWGFVYPSYQYGVGYKPSFGDLLYSYYGLMPCPTTMVVLSIFSLTYPLGNKMLFCLMTMYALLIGTATVATGWLPDIPFVLIGIYTLILFINIYKKNKLERKTQSGW